MPKERLSMRKIKEVLRLKGQFKFSDRQIAKSCGIARSTVADYLLRARAAGIPWPLPPDLTEQALETRLFPPVPAASGGGRPLPNWPEVHRELRKKGVTLALLWEEYKATHPDGFQYSHFCELYGAWRRRLDPVMRQEHLAGEKLFVDYCGQTVAVVDRATGQAKNAQIFVAVLGASNYTFAEATWSQSLSDWIGSHQRAFRFFGGVPELVVPDNLKSGVTTPCRYDPDINPTYHALAVHYGTAILPARIKKPRDKAKVEKGVQLVERWILARLRHQTFFSLEDLNQAIRNLLDSLNSRPFRKLPGCRLSLFQAVDQPALRHLPAEPFPDCEWHKLRAGPDYHVEWKSHFYSVPHTLARLQLDVRITPRTIECFHQGKRVASHALSSRAGGKTTLAQHLSPKHRLFLENQSVEKVIQQAGEIGVHTEQLIRKVLTRRSHPQQGARACQGILGLANRYGVDRLEAACARALAIGARSLKSIKSILKNGLDRHPIPNQEAPQVPTILHDNIRGSGYYH